MIAYVATLSYRRRNQTFTYTRVTRTIDDGEIGDHIAYKFTGVTN